MRDYYHWTNKAAIEKIMKVGLKKGSNVTIKPACAYAKYFADWSKGMPKDLVLLKMKIPSKCIKDDFFGECISEEGEIWDKEITCKVKPQNIKKLPKHKKKLYIEVAKEESAED